MDFAKGLLGLLLISSMLLLSANADAAVPRMGIGDLTDESDAIVYGRVLSLVPHWDDAHEMIYTTVTVQPIAYMKGDLGSDPIRFEMPGGTVGEMTLAVSDVPRFDLGEEAVPREWVDGMRKREIIQGALSRLP